MSLPPTTPASAAPIFKQVFAGGIGKLKPGRSPKKTHAALLKAAQRQVDALKKKQQEDLLNTPKGLGEGLGYMDKAFWLLADTKVPAEERCDEARNELSMALTRIREGLRTLIHHGQLGGIDDLVMDAVVPASAAETA
jgi:hypothetical protein